MTNKLPMPKPSDAINIILYSRKSRQIAAYGLIPLLGLPFAMMAFLYGRKATAICKGFWNPAEKELKRASSLSLIGFAITLGPLIVFTVGLLCGAWPWPGVN